MRKSLRVYPAPFFFVLLTMFVGALLNSTAEAKQRRASSGKTKAASGKKATAKSAKSAKGKISAKASVKAVARGGKSRRETVATRGKSSRSSRGRVASREPKVNTKQMQSLLRKRGKLTKSERQLLSRRRAAQRRRAETIRLARLRAIRARDEALRSSAASNIANDNAAGEDPEIRTAAVNALQGRSGTVVVMDPNTGRVYSVVNQQMALGSPVKPCSTVKLIVGLAALHEGVFDPNEDVQISTRASMNLTDALARSNNPVFQALGRMLGYERVMKYAANFGFGDRTGINYPGESDGFLPEEGDQETGLMSSHGEGFGVTAIQLAAFTGAIANGGNLYVPRVPRSLEDVGNFRPQLKRRIEISPEDRLRMMAGMTGAVNFGTGKLAYNSIGPVAGKTGTCTGSRDKLGLFTSFSSEESPRLVVTVITTGSAEAGKRAAEIAGRIYGSISPRFFRDRLSIPAVAGVDTQINNPRN